MADHDEATGVTVRRTFRARRETVFAAWTQPEALKRWWSPPGLAAPLADIELEPGGKYRFEMLKGGRSIFVSGRFLEVRAPERLVYTWRWQGTVFDHAETQVTVEFFDRGDTTEVVVVHERFPSPSMRRSHIEGWEDTFARLELDLARGPGRVAP